MPINKIPLYTLNQIKDSIRLEEHLEKLLSGQRQAFVDYSQGKYTLPSPTQMIFDKGSDCHMKAGFKKGHDTFVVKMATSALATTSVRNVDGLYTVFSQQTGQLQAIIVDHGYLTILRTALAAALCIDLTPHSISNIGITGTGNLSKQVFTVLKYRYPKARFYIWGRSMDKMSHFIGGHTVLHPSDLLPICDVIVTATSSHQPYLNRSYPMNGKSIIALGSDDHHKQECVSELLESADAIFVDSFDQSKLFGEVYKARQHGFLQNKSIHEIGNVIQDKAQGSFIFFDLSGIAAQDMAIAHDVISILDKDQRSSNQIA